MHTNPRLRRGAMALSSRTSHPQPQPSSLKSKTHLPLSPARATPCDQRTRAPAARLARSSGQRRAVCGAGTVPCIGVGRVSGAQRRLALLSWRRGMGLGDGKTEGLGTTGAHTDIHRGRRPPVHRHRVISRASFKHINASSSSYHVCHPSVIIVSRMQSSRAPVDRDRLV